MSVATHLTALASDLIPDVSEKDSIVRSLATLKSRLSTYLASDVKEHIQFGSSTRGTMLTRAGDEDSDVDYMIVFDNDERVKPQSMIARLRRFAESSYASSEIYQSHPTVVLNLNHIRFELVPAYRSWYSLYIPAPASAFNDWMETDPNGFNEKLENKNKAEGSFIKPLIRLLKYWNARSGHVFESYELEKWIVGHWYISSGSLKPYVYEAVEDLEDSWSMAQWRKDRIARAKELIANTKEYERREMPSTAEKEIRKLFPDL